MSAAVAGVAQRPPARRSPVPTSLAAFQAVRLLRHPLSLAGFALTVVVVVLSSRQSPQDAFSAVTSSPTFYYGVPVFFAANLVASRERRAHSDELLAPTATSEQRRTAAMLTATLAPAAAVAVLVVVVHAVLLAGHRYVEVPGFWYMAQVPVTVLGAGLLGVAVARWFPVRGASFVVMVALVAWDVWTSNHPYTVRLLGLYVEWPSYGVTTEWAGVFPGSPALHVVYLAALCGLAAVGAMLPGSGRRRVPLLALGGLLVVLAGVAGTVQLP